MQPVLVYDGDCSVCTKLARIVTTRLRPTPSRYAVSAWQDLDLTSLGLTPEACDGALQWVDTNGRVHAAQNAVARLLLASRLWARPAGAVLLMPGINQLAGVIYRWVAVNRDRLPGGTPACSLPAAQRPA